jgi:protein-S-isoprenylcysteine O-methyltransferase Ste14
VRRLFASGTTALLALGFLGWHVLRGDALRAGVFVLPNLLPAVTVAVLLLVSLSNRPAVVDDRWHVLAVSFAASNLYLLVPLAGVALFSDHAIPWLRQIAALGIVGTLPVYLIVLFTLGRDLTVLPEANSLRTGGVYAISRHPLYAVYIVWCVLQALLCQTPAVVVLAAAQVWMQVTRARHEERVLEAAFPEYASYRERVGWFWPKPAAARR